MTGTGFGGVDMAGTGFGGVDMAGTGLEEWTWLVLVWRSGNG